MAGYSYNGSKTNGRLKILDLSGARIVAGGEMYLDATKLLSGKNAYSLGTFQYSIDTPDVFPERIFQGCNLESITLPETTTQVGNSALGACLELESVIIPGSATKIDKSAITIFEIVGRRMMENGRNN